ncbi:MAG: NTP transferase domain-containing protein, partial [Lentisphaerae bacterium]|nr:NTP transferase domain-containing protein [Lentisphaerota bacterium]
MFALIMAGGLGTRLREMHPDLPKLLVPLANRPFLEWQLDWMMAGGITRVHIAGGHLGQQINEYIEKHPRAGLSISFSAEPVPLGTAGAPKFVEKHLPEDTFFSINGDTLLPSVDFMLMHKRGLNSGIVACVAVSPIEHAGRYGTVIMDEDGLVTGFREKSVNTAGWVNGGVCLMKKEILEYIETEKKVSLESEIYPKLVQENLISAFKTEPPLLDMGTPDGIEAMEKFLHNYPEFKEVK